MKCPKCSYLGFETGERCKNCGYDFSLLVEPPTDGPAELRLREAAREGGDVEIYWERTDGGATTGAFGDVSLQAQASRLPDDAQREHGGEDASLVEVPLQAAHAPDLPLFLPDEEDDAPLVRLPVAPRAPLSVRKTPDMPRLRPVTRAAGTQTPAFEFTQEAEPEPAPARVPAPAPARPVVRVAAAEPPAAPDGLQIGAIGARAVAALIDHAILLGIDLAVVYFTLRMTELQMYQLRVLPLAPLITFLLFVKVAYFSAFTSIGGQTIGKMAARLKVVADGARPLGVGRALRRSVAGLVSLASLGAGFLPVAFGTERRAFHDRVAGTRVVALPTA